MDLLSARSSYLNDIEALMTRCSSKFESLVTSIGWSMDSLNKHVEDDDLDEDSMLQENTLGVKQEVPISESKDYEKMYNDLIASIPNQQKKNQERSEAELLVNLLELKRNMKRRRISYKNKVHTKNKSHTEVLRALVREQMDVLKEIAGPELKEEVAEDKRLEDKEEETEAGLIQLGYPRGNPYTTWQKIGQVVGSRNLEDSELRTKPGRTDAGKRRIDSRNRDQEQHQSKRSHHSKDSVPGSSRRFQTDHDDRFHRKRSSCERERDFSRGRLKYDKGTRRSPDSENEHKSRRHHSKASY